MWGQAGCVCAHREGSARWGQTHSGSCLWAMGLGAFFIIFTCRTFYTIIVDLLSLERNNKAVLVLEKKEGDWKTSYLALVHVRV